MQFFTRLLVAACLLIVGCLLTSPAQAQRLRTSRYERGMLDKGRKIGIWDYFGYTPSGEQVVVQRYDHDKNQLLFFRPGAESLYHIEVSPGKWSYVRPDRPPLFVGSDAALASYTAKMSYPEAAQARNIQGKVVVVFTIDTLGHASGHHLAHRIGGGCDEEALRVGPHRARPVGTRPAWAAVP